MANAFDSIKLKGKIDIVDSQGNLILTRDNLVLESTRALVLYLLFRDPNIFSALASEQEESSSILYTPIIDGESYTKMICGFSIGENGVALQTNGYVPYVPTYNDYATIDSTKSTFRPLPFITVDSDGDLYSSDGSANGSYENLSEITNKSMSLSDGSIIETTTTDTSGNTSSIVKYFNFNFGTTTSTSSTKTSMYCKTFDISNSTVRFNKGEIEYTVKLEVESWDLQGYTFSELGLVIGDCVVSTDGTVSSIKSDSGILATRCTFSPISLSSNLLSSFNIYYHIYI